MITNNKVRLLDLMSVFAFLNEGHIQVIKEVTDSGIILCMLKSLVMHILLLEEKLSMIR